MEQPPPQPLDYAGPRERSKPDGSSKRVAWNVVSFFVGLGVGVIASCVAYLGGSEFRPGLILWVAVGKFAAASFVAVIPKMWAFAGGLLLSVPVGALIFFGACSSNFKI